MKREIVKIKNKNNGHMIKHYVMSDGRELNRNQIAKEVGISPEAVDWRVNNKWSNDELLLPEGSTLEAHYERMRKGQRKHPEESKLKKSVFNCPSWAVPRKEIKE